MSLQSLRDLWANLDETAKADLLVAEEPVQAAESGLQVLGMGLIAEPVESAFDGIRIVDEHATNPNVTGPCCRRVKALDNILDLTQIPVAERESLLATGGLPLLSAICGICIGRFMRGGGKRSDLYEALGAPAALVDNLRSLE